MLLGEHDGDLFYEMSAEDWADIESAMEWEASEAYEELVNALEEEKHGYRCCYDY